MNKLFILVAIVPALISCRSLASGKNRDKDLVGINEQLYNLEKQQHQQEAAIAEQRRMIEELRQAPQKSVPAAETAVDVEKQYQDAYTQFSQGNFERALAGFVQIVEKHRFHPLLDNALYWIGECYLRLHDTEQALLYFQSVYTLYPFGNKADHALYKIGLLFLEKNDPLLARLAFQRLLEQYPQSDFRQSAAEKLSQKKPPSRRKK